MIRYFSRLLIISIFALLFFSKMLYCQEWAPIGAKWYYSTSGNNGSGGLLIIESQKDTVIETLDCKKFKFSDIWLNQTGPNDSHWETYNTYEFFYFNSDSVSHYDKLNGYFYKLYDFTAEAGDTIVVRNEEYPGELPYSNFEYILDSVVVKDIDGFSLKHFYVHASPTSDWVFTSPYQPLHAIIENIGSTISFLGISLDVLSLDWGNQYFLRCYIDDNINYHFELYPSELECDYLPTILDYNILGEISIYPNPVKNFLFINTENNHNQLITISDLQGKLIYREKVNGHEMIDMSRWESGVYFIRMNVNNQVILNKLILKL